MVDGGEKVGVFIDLETLNPNINGVESGGDYDVFHCHEAANKRIKLTQKENDQQVALAEILLNLPSIGLKLYNLPDLVNTTKRNLNYLEQQAMTHRDYYGAQQMTEKEKLKASNFTATLLRIGSWERVTRNEGDLVAKCYYAKKKLVWEFLERGLKSKIEIQWSDILAIRADIQENKPGILEIELSKAPTFHEETDPQPRKHTIWRLTTDFTGGEASKWRRHYLRFPPGSLDKHYEKLLQCDSRLLAISRQRFPSLKSPIFESNSFGFPGFSLDFSGQGVHMNHPGMHWPIAGFSQPSFVQNQLYCQPFHETRSPISVMDFSHSDEFGGNNIVENSRRMTLWGTNSGYQGPQSTSHQFHHHRPDQAFVMNRVQGIESIVSSTTPLNQNASYIQNCSLAPYDQAVELQHEMQEQLLSEVEAYNSFRVEPLNALVNFAKVQKGNSTSESNQILYGGGFDQIYDQQQQIAPYDVHSHQSSQEDTMTHHHQLLWNNTVTYPSLLEGYEHHENALNDENLWS